MRKSVSGLVLIATLLLSGCSGDTSRVAIELGPSERFSAAELGAAADAVLAEFHTFKGCTLLRLSYDEEESLRHGSLSYPPPGEVDVVIFTSDFSVDFTGGDGSLEPNSTYRNWSWEVVRDGEGEWAVTNWGVA